MNDTAEMMQARRGILIMSWIVIVIFPLILAGLAFTNNWDIRVVDAVFFGVLLLFKLFGSLALSQAAGGVFVIRRRANENLSFQLLIHSIKAFIYTIQHDKVCILNCKH